jgi:hypothetical protein
MDPFFGRANASVFWSVIQIKMWVLLLLLLLLLLLDRVSQYLIMYGQSIA